MKWLRGRRGRRLAVAYLVLLLASHAVQWSGHGSFARPTADGEFRFLSLPRQTAAGPAVGSPVRVAYRDVGDGPAIILLHGSPGVAANFDHLIPLLSPHHRVIVPDLPGFGRSDRFLPDYGILAHSRYLLALMDQLELRRVHVLGFSMGSGVALNMADLAPDRISSLTLYGGIGIQEGEGSGSWSFEHFKYAVGYAALVVGAEGVPHFGLLGPWSLRHSFIRNFWDTDQRPLRQILQRLQTPLLILHGAHDPLVPAWVAEEHHRLVPHSEYVLFDASHFMLFREDQTASLASALLPFLRRHDDPSAAPTPRVLRHTPIPQSPDQTVGAWTRFVGLMGGTLVSEDLTCIATGQLMGQRKMDPFLGVMGCFLGIYIGDLGLWAFGRWVGRRLRTWPTLTRRIPDPALRRFGDWFDRHAGRAVFAARFIPGTRLPLYLAAGTLGRKGWRFAGWTFAAALVWTPLVVLLVAVFGDRLVKPLRIYLGAGWGMLAGLLLIYLLLRCLTMMTTRIGRAKFIASVSRIWRWEFWPAWIFYPPIALWISLHSLRRGGFRGFASVTAANPGIPDGGFVGESKYQILRSLRSPFVLPTVMLEPSDLAARLERLVVAMQAHGWAFPIILKPDVGQRGAGLKKAASLDDAGAYLATHRSAVIAQPFHPGPYEAGVFYYRFPNEPHGRIFSITDKHFSSVLGDGRSTLEELIWSHPRYRMQANRFLERHASQAQRVLDKAEVFALAVAGNHAQGTLFRDGSHLLTPELEATVDVIARSFPTFYFGRFDVRYTDVEAFRAGRDLAVIELNGVTSESTNIYDPSWSLWQAYQTLGRQWSVLFRIADLNIQSGFEPTPPWELWRRIRGYYRNRETTLIGD